MSHHSSSWAHCDASFNYNYGPLGPASCCTMIHEPANKWWFWEFHEIEGFCIGSTITHCRNYNVFLSKSRAISISDIVEFRNDCITVPEIKAKDRVIDAEAKLKYELGVIPLSYGNDQLQSIENIREIFIKCRRREPIFFY